MSTEAKLREYILDNYKSIRDFVRHTDLPYTTVDGILKRGIDNASIGNVLKICKTLNISSDELANGRIVPLVSQKSNDIAIFTEITRMVSFMKNNIKEYQQLTIDGDELSETEVEMLIDSLVLTIAMIRRNRSRREEK